MFHAGGQIPGQILKTCAKVNSSLRQYWSCYVWIFGIRESVFLKSPFCTKNSRLFEIDQIWSETSGSKYFPETISVEICFLSTRLTPNFPRDTTVSLKTKPFTYAYFPFIHRRNKPQPNVRRLPKKKNFKSTSWRLHLPVADSWTVQCTVAPRAKADEQNPRNLFRLICSCSNRLVASACGRLRDKT